MTFMFRKLCGVALSIAFFGAGFSAVAADCTIETLDLRWDGGASRYNVEVVDDEKERAKGLMFREKLGRFSGMLFVYENEQEVSFWMENTLIPLDMLFFNKSGVLSHIHENAIPKDRTPIPGGGHVMYVLEVNAGTVKKLNIPLGAEMRHPAISAQDAAWGC